MSKIIKKAKLSCDGSNDRTKGSWEGELEMDFSGLTPEQIMQHAASKIVIQWQTAHRKKINELRGQKLVKVKVNAPGSRMATTPTEEQIEQHIEQTMSVEKLEALLKAKRAQSK